MAPFDLKHESFLKLATRTPAEVLAAYQGADIVVLALAIPDTTLTTLLTLPPAGKYFTQDWWLGSSYLKWRRVAGFDAELVKSVLASLKKMRLAIRKVPMNLLALEGGLDEARGGATLARWGEGLFLSATLPTGAVEPALQGFEASLSWVWDCLMPLPNSGYVSTEFSRYGEVEVERAFACFSFGDGYRNPLAKQFAKLGVEGIDLPRPDRLEQERMLKDSIAALERICAQAPDNRADLWLGAHRHQSLPMVDAQDGDPVLMPMVARLNTLRARALKMLKFPHFHQSVAVRQLDASANCRQEKYRYLASDRDWMLRLHKISPQSFSPDFDELRDVDDYLSALHGKYPCLTKDPLQGVLPEPSMVKFKL